MKKKSILFALAAVCLPLALSAQKEREITLNEAIAMARIQSVDAAVALNELKTAYWEFRTFRADLLPEVNLTGTLPNYNKSYSSYQNSDGSYGFVRNNTLGLTGDLSIDQNIWLTGGKLSLTSSLDYIKQLGAGGDRHFMSVPVTLQLTQPIFGVNNIKWNRRIEGEDEVLNPVLPEAVDGPRMEYNQVLNKALERNSFAQNIRRRQLEADYEVATARGNLRSVDLFASVGYTGENRNFPAVYRNLQDNQIVQVGVKIPILDWGKRRGKVRVAKSNRDVVLSKIRQEQINFNQDIFLLVEHFNNQAQQLDIAKEADAIAQQRYKTSIETFLIGKINTLDLNDAQNSKDEARQKHISELYYYWYYYYQIRSLTLWDFRTNTELEADFDEIIRQ